MCPEHPALVPLSERPHQGRRSTQISSQAQPPGAPSDARARETPRLPVRARDPSVESASGFVRLNGDRPLYLIAPTKIAESCSKSGDTSTTTSLMPVFGTANPYFPLFARRGAICPDNP